MENKLNTYQKAANTLSKFRSVLFSVLAFGLLFGFTNEKANAETSEMLAVSCEISVNHGQGFKTTIKSVVDNCDGTHTITLKVSHNGCEGPACKEISNYAIQAAPGTYSDISVGNIVGGFSFSNVDMGPNLGAQIPFNGFKIDGAGGLGDGMAGSFEVTYTLSGGLQDQKVSVKPGPDTLVEEFTKADFESVMNCQGNTCADGPTANNDSATTPFNTPVDIDILDNDVAGDNPLDPNSVTFIAGTEPNAATEGEFTYNPSTGLATFTPVSGFSGVVTIDYEVCDTIGLCDIATITVTVEAAPVGPTANDDSATTPFNTPVDIDILDNDVAGDNPLNPNSVTFVAGTEPDAATEGEFTYNPTTGKATFTPVSGFSGVVTIDYEVCDTIGLCDIATITVTVEAAPVGPTANDDSATTPFETPVDISILDNDVAGDNPLDPNTVEYIAGTEPDAANEGVFTYNASTSKATFTPASGFSGTVTIDYKVCDTAGLCDEATITVVVLPPSIVDDARISPILECVSTLGGGLYRAEFSYETFNTTDITIPAGSDNRMIGGGSSDQDRGQTTLFEFPAPNFPSNDRMGRAGFFPNNAFSVVFDGSNLTWSLKGPDGQTRTATASANSLDCSTKLDGPTANDDSATTDVDTPVTIDILDNDVAGDNPLDPNSVEFIVGTEPNPVTEGVFTYDASTELATFTPATGFTGTVTIDYRVCDTVGLCDTATITVVIVEPSGPIDNLFPVMGFGTLAYEDLWPGKGDFDFNDLVIDYQFEITSDASNKIEQVVGTFVIQAFGAGYQNGFGFQLSDAIDASDLTVTGSSITENYITLDANGTEAGQNAPTIIVFDNNYNEMQHPGVGIGVNTETSAPYVQPATLTITIDFPAGKYSWNDLDIANFNPFLIVNQDRGREVHLPGYAPTALADLSLFGTIDDASDLSQGITYVTENNLPWAINIYEKFDYPIEKQDIIWVHLKFVEWAESGGVLFPDWFKNLPGYRNQALIYQIP